MIKRSVFLHLHVGNMWIYDCSITAICTASVGIEH